MKILGTAAFLILAAVMPAQNFTWVRGSNTTGNPGVYGTQGFPAPANDPGSRHGSVTWVDNAGDLWLFGGEQGNATQTWYSDLWKYNRSMNQWTWVKGPNSINNAGVYGTQGVAAPANQPGAREFAVSWTDASGNFWLFGGEGYGNGSASGDLNDLWKYDPLTNLWTWMKGSNGVDQNGTYNTQGVPAPGNLPGARHGSATWKDNSGNFWMFGGRGIDAVSTGAGYLNDLWRYNIASNTWTWMHGSNSNGLAGTYGTLGVPASANTPGTREFPSFWTGSAGEFYLLGGRGMAGTSNAAHINDFWKYDVATNMWTWLNGVSTNNPLSIYGTTAVASPANEPGGLFGTSTWTDAQGKLWLFGGRGYSSSFISQLNVLMKYDPITNEWTTYKGNLNNSSTGTPASYGTLGVPAPSNLPGSRYHSAFWNDNSGGLWLFGGLGLATSTTLANNNDMWKFELPCNPDSISIVSGQICSGGTTTLTAYNQFPSNVEWYTSPNSTVSLGNGVSYTTVPLVASSGSVVYTYYAEANGCSFKPRTAVSVTVYPRPQVSVTSPSVACNGTTFTVSGSGATTYTWQTGSNLATITVTATAPQMQLILIGSNSFGCENSASATVTVFPSPVVTVTTTNKTLCPGSTATLTAGGALNFGWSSGQTISTITVAPTGNTTYTVTGTDANQCSATAIITQSMQVCTSINERSEFTRMIGLYPNPANGSFTIKVEGQEAPGVILIINSISQIVMTLNVSSSEIKIDERLPAGFYTLLFKENGRIIGRKGFVVN